MPLHQLIEQQLTRLNALLDKAEQVQAEARELCERVKESKSFAV